MDLFFGEIERVSKETYPVWMLIPSKVMLYLIEPRYYVCTDQLGRLRWAVITAPVNQRWNL